MLEMAALNCTTLKGAVEAVAESVAACVGADEAVALADPDDVSEAMAEIVARLLADAVAELELRMHTLAPMRE